MNSGNIPNQRSINEWGWVRRVAVSLLVLATFWALYGPSYSAQVRRSSDPLVTNDDARQQIWPFYHFADSKLFANDYIGDYYLAWYPVGFRALYSLGAKAWDPAALSKVLSCILFAFFLAAMAFAAWRWSGTPAALATVALCLSSGVFLEELGGGLPRSFGFPMIGIFVAALIWGRTHAMAAATIVAAAFYPTPAVIGGITLAAWLFLVPSKDRGDAENWSFRRRTILLVATGILTVSLALPGLLGAAKYGPLLTPKDVTEYPELGPNGRYTPQHRAPFPGLITATKRYMNAAFAGGGDLWLDAKRSRPSGIMLVLLLAPFAGYVSLLRRDSAARRLTALAFAAVVGFEISKPLAPLLYLPERYLLLSVPVLAVLTLPAALGELVRLSGRVRDSKWARPAAILAGTSVCLLLLGGSGGGDGAFSFDLRAEKPLYERIARLPPDALVAGWPTGPIENVPYVCRRRALVTKKNHQVFHKQYAEEMRRRTNAFMEAYFSALAGPILRLRDDFKVTHILVDARHFTDSPPTYFKPFDARIKSLYFAGKQGGFEMLRQLDSSAEPSYGAYYLIDLSRLRLD